MVLTFEASGSSPLSLREQKLPLLFLDILSSMRETD